MFELVTGSPHHHRQWLRLVSVPSNYQWVCLRADNDGGAKTEEDHVIVFHITRVLKPQFKPIGCVCL